MHWESIYIRLFNHFMQIYGLTSFKIFQDISSSQLNHGRGNFGPSLTGHTWNLRAFEDHSSCVVHMQVREDTRTMRDLYGKQGSIL